MKKILISLMLTSVSWAARVPVNDIRFNTVRPENQLVRLLRNKVDALNDRIDNAGTQLGTGNVFYVDSAVGSDSYVGTSPATARATLEIRV